MINKVKDGGVVLWNVECNNCGETERYNRNEYELFKDICTQNRKDGWVHVLDTLDGEVWKHFCTQCRSIGFESLDKVKEAKKNVV